MNDQYLILLPIVFTMGLPLILIVIGLTVGTALEKRHIRALGEQELALKGIVVTNHKRLPGGADEKVILHLVSGEVVLSADFFKNLRAALRHLTGGRLYSLEGVLERARREAVVRMKSMASRQGAHMIINARIETSRIGSTMVEVLAYGTAVSRGNNREVA
ncbi:YbjQ family protein [Myxococcota bacterium]|nr:YbjQ family protein [Myxococcota bacterium]MBU1534127.1 YbjQ family protein [Myxococcota bacterium]